MPPCERSERDEQSYPQVALSTHDPQAVISTFHPHRDAPDVIHSRNQPQVIPSAAQHFAKKETLRDQRRNLI